MAHGMKDRYQKEVVPALMKTLKLENVMEVPRIEKVVVNIGLGEALDNAKALDAAVADITQVTGLPLQFHQLRFFRGRLPIAVLSTVATPADR